MTQKMNTSNSTKVMRLAVDLIMGYIFVGCSDGSVEIMLKEKEGLASNLMQRFIGQVQITAITWSKST